MGNGSSKNTSDSINILQWHKTTNNFDGGLKHGSYSVLTNKYTNEEIDFYQIICPNAQQHRLNIQYYHWRRNQNNIVKTLYLEEKKAQNVCSTSYIIYLFLEHIVFRLPDVNNIPYPDNLYILNSLLSGYSKLYYQFGYFDVYEDQVCFDTKGDVKVWINGDLSAIYPTQSKDTIEQNNIKSSSNYKNQQKMVNDIITLVNKYTDHSLEQISISQYLKKQANKNYLTFRNAKTMLKQYSINCKAPIPNYCQSIFKIYDWNKQLAKDTLATQADKNNVFNNIQYTINADKQNKLNNSNVITSYNYSLPSRVRSINKRYQKLIHQNCPKNRSISYFHQKIIPNIKTIQRYPDYRYENKIKKTLYFNKIPPQNNQTYANMFNRIRSIKDRGYKNHQLNISKNTNDIFIKLQQHQNYKQNHNNISANPINLKNNLQKYKHIPKKKITFNYPSISFYKKSTNGMNSTLNKNDNNQCSKELIEEQKNEKIILPMRLNLFSKQSVPSQLQEEDLFSILEQSSVKKNNSPFHSKIQTINQKYYSSIKSKQQKTNFFSIQTFEMQNTVQSDLNKLLEDSDTNFISLIKKQTKDQTQQEFFYHTNTHKEYLDPQIAADIQKLYKHVV